MFEYPLEVPCPTCGGTGYFVPIHPDVGHSTVSNVPTCRTCNGQGWIYTPVKKKEV